MIMLVTPPLVLPSGYLTAGHSYRWNMRASNSAGFSGYSTLFYFQTTGGTTSTFEGIDYRDYGATATSGVNVSGIVAAGKEFVCEYIGTAVNDGYLRPADVTTLTGQGLAIVSIFERTPTSTSYFTVSQADSDAQVAIEAAIEAGQPSGSAIYFTVDYAADSTALPSIDSYFQEIRNYFNQYFSTYTGITYKIGVYAPGNVLPTIMSDANVGASYSWLAEPWGVYSYSSENLAQIQDDVTVAGMDVDLDEAYTTDFGQWGSSSVTPIITVSTTSLTLPSTTQGTAGTTTSFTVGGSGLGSSDTVTLSAPTGSEISQSSSSGFGSTVTLHPDTSGNLSTTTIYARISASATANVSGNLTIDDALNNSLDKSIQVNGTVSGATSPAITSPVPTSTLSSSSATFQWSSGTGVSDYVLYVGTSFDTYDIYDSPYTLNLSLPVSGLPVDGSTIYVRLWWEISGGWSFADYTYTAYTMAVDTQGPALTIGSPLNNATVTSASLPVSGTASDNGYGNNGISSVTVNGVSASGGTAGGTGTANWNATVTLVSGVNTITVVAKDTLNNSTNKVVSVTYNPPDTQGPALTITSPLNNAVVTSASLPVNGTASDSGLGNNGVSSVTVNGVSASGGTASGSGTANWSTTVTLVSGLNTITVVAKDTLNNSTNKVVSVTYNPPRPVFGGLSVSSGQLQTTLSGLSTGEKVVLYGSTDLKTWTPIQTNTVSGSTLPITSAINPGMKAQYFRVMVQ